MIVGFKYRTKRLRHDDKITNRLKCNYAELFLEANSFLQYLGDYLIRLLLEVDDCVAVYVNALIKMYTIGIYH